MAKVAGARIFFDIIGQFQAKRLLGDSEQFVTAQRAIIGDAIAGVADSFMDMSSFILEGTDKVVSAFHEHSEQLARVKKFYNDSEEAAIGFANAAIRMGEAFAFSGAESMAAASRTAQLKGVLQSQQAVVEATRQGLLLAQIGEMETEEGMNRFINLAQQTSFMLGGLTQAQYNLLTAEQQANLVREQSIHALNQLNTIENSSVATMEDITFVLNQYSSQASIAGESIGDMAAMAALLLETGEEVSRAGTGLRMIYQRLGNANNEATKAISELIEGVDAQGVASMKLSDVLLELAPAYKEMSAEEKRALAVNVAGSRHYIKFLKLMENQNRLLFLQKEAFEGNYGAIDEFALKTKSAAFEVKKAEAELENLRVEVGEELHQAFMTAFRAEEMMLKGFSGLITQEGLLSKGLNNLTGMSIGLSSVFQKTIQPLSEFALSAFNMYISLKTLKAIMPENMAQASVMAKTYQQTSVIMSLNEDILKTYRHELVKTNMGMNRYQQGLMSTMAHQEKKLVVDRQLIKSELKQAEAMQKAFYASKKKVIEGTSMSKNAIMARRTNDQLTSAVQRQKKAFDEARLAVNQIRRARRLEVDVISQSIVANKANRALMEGRDYTAQYASMDAQKKMVKTLGIQNNLMSQEVVLHQQLKPSVLSGLQARNDMLLTKQRDAQATLAALNAEKAYAISMNKTTVDIDKQIAVRKEAIMTMGQERAEINLLLMANETLDAEMKASIVTNKTLAMAVKETSVAYFQQRKHVNAARGGLMMMSLILPHVVEQEHQMAAMVAMASGSMVSMLVPAINLTNGALTRTAILTTAATAGLNLVIAAGAALAAYGGFKTLEKFDLIPEMFKSEIGVIEELNESLDRTSTLLSDLQGASGEGAVLSGMYETTFNELKQDATMTSALLSKMTFDINKQKDDIQKAIATQGAGSPMVQGMRNTLYLMEQAQEQVSAIQEAQSVVAGNMVGMQVGIELDTKKNLFESTGVIDALFDYEDYVVSYTNLEGNFIEERYETEAEAFARRSELQEEYQTEYLDYTIDYYKKLLDVGESGNEAILESERQLYNSLLQTQEEFATAREELFFGNKANFTGAIYKQVTQGGVENLLHKTEVIQANNFYGYNTEEMVDRVTKGVLDELRTHGLSV